MQTNRLFQIIYILLREGTVTAGELAKRFEVSPRTIYRDIDALSLAGVPVYASKGKGGGISLLQDFVLDKSLLSETEQNAVLTALQGFLPLQVGEDASVLEKLSAFWGRNVVPWLKIDFSDWGDSNKDLFEMLKTAVTEQHIIHFDYYNSFGEKTHRQVEPVQIWFKHRAWYLHGYCLSKKEFRTFKLTRIQNLTVTNEPCIPGRLDVTEAWAADEKEDSKAVSLILKFAPETAYRIYDEFDESQIEKQEDGSFLVSVTWPEDNWVWSFLLSFGESVRVIEPGWVQTIIRKKALQIAEKYI